MQTLNEHPYDPVLLRQGSSQKEVFCCVRGMSLQKPYAHTYNIDDNYWHYRPCDTQVRMSRSSCSALYKGGHYPCPHTVARVNTGWSSKQTAIW